MKTPATSPFVSQQGAILIFACRHPATSGVFPADRDVFLWFIRGDFSAYDGGICSPNDIAATHHVLPGNTPVHGVPTSGTLILPGLM